MDCTGRWIEKIVACKRTTTNCQTTTYLSGHELFESRLGVFRPQEGRTRTGAYMFKYTTQKYLAHAVGSVREKSNIRIAACHPRKRTRKVMGQSGGLQILSWRRP